MLSVNQLSFGFPQKTLYNQISFTLEAGQHCAFIGTSGNGKSTLIEMIMDPDKYMYDGKLELAPDCKIGYVSQFGQTDKSQSMTVFEYIGNDFIQLQKQLDAICTEMETATDIEPLLEKYQLCLDTFDALGGNEFESIIDKQLRLANLIKHKDLKVSELSGGEFKLIQVIKEMLNSPDLMIMDEPDVYLDFENINALRNLINSHKGTLLIITHNRYLLNHCFNKIIHLENTELQEFDGRYMDYNFSLLQRKIELQELAFKDTEEIARNEMIIDRLRLKVLINSEASRGKALNARVKVQERLEARRIKMPFVELNQPTIQWAATDPLPDAVAIKVKNYQVSFDDLLLEKVTFEIKSNEKVALIGPNGTGKTTLLRDLYKNNHPAIEIHEGIQTAYLSQFQGEVLNEANTLFEEFFEAGFKSYDDITSYLSDYGFVEETLKLPISTLSGGEKNTLQLAKIATQKANMLLLDEPTSHLDTYAQFALEKAIENYTGAILMISHDFYSIINCMDSVLIIKDKTIQKMSIRNFRKMIYTNHFDKGYLESEQKKKAIELEIAIALKNADFEAAKLLSETLEALIKLL